MIETATASMPSDPRVCFSPGAVEHLPYADGIFDLVVSTMSFDHWADQRRGLAECARVMSPTGCLVLTDLFSLLLLPTQWVGRRGHARTVGRASQLLREAGLGGLAWQGLSGITVLAGLLIRTVTATAPPSSATSAPPRPAAPNG